jgi:hypothetical protein
VTEVEKRPIGSLDSFLRGILGGSLVGSGIFSLSFGAGAQAVIFIIGLVIVIDTIISKTEEIYPMSMFLGSVIGFFIALFAVIAEVSLYYTALIFILAVIVYLGRLFRRLGRA